MKQVTGAKMNGKEIGTDDVDAASLDLDFIAAFNDLLWSSEDSGHELRKETIAAMCSACDERLERLKQFIEKVPIAKQTPKAA